MHRTPRPRLGFISGISGAGSLIRGALCPPPLTRSVSISPHMQLSDKEKRIVERLKRRQRSLVRWRWVGLIGALVYIAVGLYGLVLALHFLNRPETTPDLVIACMLPMAFGLFALGVLLVSYLVLRWNGHPETLLLLRLIENAQHDC